MPVKTLLSKSDQLRENLRAFFFVKQMLYRPGSKNKYINQLGTVPIGPIMHISIINLVNTQYLNAMLYALVRSVQRMVLSLDVIFKLESTAEASTEK